MNLGEVLQSARTAAGLSIDDLASITSIRAGLISKMESNDFSDCGGDIYARGHLRNLAPKLGLDANQLVEIYNEEHSIESRSINEMLAENNVMANPIDKKTISWKTLAGISLATLALLGAVQIIISNSKTTTISNPEVIATESATAEPSNTPVAQPTQSESAAPELPRDTYSSGSGVAVSVTATRGTSWLFVSDASGTTLYSGQIRTGQKLNFSSTTRVSLKVGNAGVVDVSVNGKTAEQIGADGEVVSVSYGVTS
jgi:cytoskeletal protein RodZ